MDFFSYDILNGNNDVIRVKKKNIPQEIIITLNSFIPISVLTAINVLVQLPALIQSGH